MDKKYLDTFSQIDATLNKYFGQYLAPYYEKEIQVLKNKQTAEINKILEKPNPGSSLSPTSATLNNINVQLRQGEWTSKHLEYCIGQANQKIHKNGQINADLTEIHQLVRAVLIEQLGGGDLKKGADKYAALSKKYGSDIASIYIEKKLQDNFVNMMTRKIPKESSALKILKKGLSESFVGMLVVSQSAESELENAIKEKANPLSRKEEVAAGAVSIATDLATMRLPGGSGLTVKAVKNAVKIEVGTRMVVAAMTDDKYKEFNKDVFGSSTALDDIEKSGRSTKSGQYMTSLNSTFNKKIKLSYSSEEVGELRKNINGLLAQGVNIKDIVMQSFSSLNIRYRRGDPPSWMISKGEEECRKLARNFCAVAIEMKQKGITSTMVGGKKMTMEEVAQRAYNYSLASIVAQSRNQSQNQARTEQSVQSDLQTIYGSNAVQGAAQQTPQSVQANAQNTSGWGGMLNTYGLSGLGDLGKNFGYVTAMLPDMLVNMFTGKSKVKLEDNLLPTAAIVLSFFVKNKFLKFLLMALGGANLINKLAHESMEKEGIISKDSKQYVTHQEQSQDPRIKNVEVRGNTMLATIDGSPYVVTLDDRSVDAYHKGSLPLSTLANAVLRQYDEQAVVDGGSAAYERAMAQSEDRRQNVAIK